MKKTVWIVFAILCIAIGFYPVTYFLLDRDFGLLQSKPDALLGNVFWNIGFYVHIVLGGLALLIGWTQFSRKWRTTSPTLHRWIGKIYVLSVLLSALAGIYIGFHATGGAVAASGFISLGVVWFFTTLQAFLAIRSGDILRHQKWMVFSYAACFAAVTLRIWLPLLILLFGGEFEPAYRIVAWLCWVPNLLVAGLLTRSLGNLQLQG